MENKVEKLKAKIIKEAKDYFEKGNFEIEINAPSIGKSSYDVKFVCLYRINTKFKQEIISYEENDNGKSSFYFNQHFLKNKKLTQSVITEENFYDLKQTVALANDFIQLVFELTNSSKITLKDLRKNKGLTQQQLADELGTSARNVQYWENTGVTSSMTKKLISLYFKVPEKLIDFEVVKSNGFKNKFIYGEKRFKYVADNLESWLPFFDKVIILLGEKQSKKQMNLFKPLLSDKVILCKNKKEYDDEMKSIIENNKINSLLVISDYDITSEYGNFYLNRFVLLKYTENTKKKRNTTAKYIDLVDDTEGFYPCSHGREVINTDKSEL